GCACLRSNSTNKTSVSKTSENLVHITHPFHPFSGRRLQCVGVRYNRYGKRFLLQVDAARICSVLPQWTDSVAPDPEVVPGTYSGESEHRFQDIVNTSWASGAGAADFLAVITMEREPERREQLLERCSSSVHR